MGPFDNHKRVENLLERVRAGNEDARNELFNTIYSELHALAHGQRRRWRGDYTLNTTALVHEAYLKVFNQTPIEARDLSHIHALSSRAMRHILINYAQHRRSLKRGGDKKILALDAQKETDEVEAVPLVPEERVDELLALDQALKRLEQVDERLVQVVECRFFGNMTIYQTAVTLGISPATVKRDWRLAQTWLRRTLDKWG